MGRINPNEAEKYDKSGNSEWLSLKDDGDVERVQFLYKEFNDLDLFAAHKVDVNGTDRYVNCTREYDSPIDDCPLCESGLKTQAVMIISMYSHNDGCIKIWERGKTFRKKLEALFNRYGDLSNMVFEIERRGKRGDKKTTYEIFPMLDVEPVDLEKEGIEKPEFLGSFILDKTPDEIRTYLDTGEFPDSEDRSEGRRGSSRRENDNSRTSRRGENTSSRRSSRRAGY